jgi:sporulation protein YlmC with PRC-barrel domain
MKKQLIIGMTTAALLGGTALAQTNPPADTGMSKSPAAQTQTNPTDKMDKSQSGMTNSATTPSAAASSNATTGVADAGDGAKGFAMSSSAATPIQYGNATSGDLMSSKLIGTDVYNNQKEKIGEIKDLAIENGKTLTGVVVSVGGFLGMGESYVLVAPSSIALNKQDGEWRAYVNTDKDSLKSAPKFTYKDGDKS